MNEPADARSYDGERFWTELALLRAMTEGAGDIVLTKPQVRRLIDCIEHQASEARRALANELTAEAQRMGMYD